jgi:3-deoxy-7-phosphoheptulonate synthase
MFKLHVQAVDAVIAAQYPHSFLSVSSQGLASIIQTSGNPDCHVILRGGSKGPNFQREHVDAVAGQFLGQIIN